MEKSNFNLKYDEFILSISYGNFVDELGGTSKAILAHKDMLDSVGISHVHIFPRLIRIPAINIFPFKHWGVIIDGHTLKQVYSYIEVIQILGHVINNGKQLREVHVHHLLNLNLKQLEKILDIFIAPIKFYLHDYYTICLQYNLLKDNGQYCGKGNVSQEKCSGCKYYLKSQIHSEKIKVFLDKYKEKIQFIAPSDTAKEIWISAYPIYNDQIRVVYHQSMLGQYRKNCEIILEESPLKIAFVGGQSINKGWNQWENVTRRAFVLGRNEEFYHFGDTNDTIQYIKKVPVFFSSENINAMVEALRMNRIDVAVLWSMWPETYSYTYYECTAANTFIITNKYSGNIATMVKERNNGIVLDNEAEFSELICNEIRLRKLVNNFKYTKNYGPLDLIENTELLQLLSKKKNTATFEIPNYKNNLFLSTKRQMVIILYKLHQFLKEVKNK